MNLDTAMTYLDFVVARHQIWEKRQAGAPTPWTDDSILRERKFTNVYRVLDPGSQFVLTDLIEDDPSPRDALMRMFLYRHTGRVEVWEFFKLMHGSYPVMADLEDGGVLETWHAYRGAMVGDRTHLGDGKTYERPLFTGAYQINGHRPIFTGAYLVFPQSAVRGTDKLESIVELTRRLFTEGGPGDILPRFLEANSQAARFATLRNNKGVADFMSMQILTDYGYSSYGGDVEDEFVVAGPGAVKGAKEIDSRKTALEVIRWAHGELAQLDISIPLPGGRARPPSIMDTQNTLCEFSKYARYMGKPPTGKVYRPAHPGTQPRPILPSHW